MKVTFSLFLLSTTILDCRAYLSSYRQIERLPTFVRSSASNDAAFSAFADSLGEEPEEPAERPWQAKLEELLDPKTNIAERQILLSELMNANDEIRESVQDALANRKVGYCHG